MTTWGKKRADILYRELFILSICGKWFKKKNWKKMSILQKTRWQRGEFACQMKSQKIQTGGCFRNNLTQHPLFYRWKS